MAKIHRNDTPASNFGFVATMLFALVASHCATTRNRANSFLRDATAATICTAAEGQYQPFMLTAPASIPAASSFPGLSAQGTFTVKPVSSDVNMRLDVCVKSDGGTEKATPKRLALVLRDGEQVRFYAPRTPTAAEQEGLNRAIFGEVDALELHFPYESGAFPAEDAEVFVKGWTIGSQSLVTVAMRRGSPGSGVFSVPSFLSVLVGTMGAGDPFPEGDCAFNQGLVERRFAMDSASFIIKACMFGGTGETTDYRVVGVQVRESRQGVPEETRQIQFEKGDIMSYQEHMGDRTCPSDKKACFAVNHHNACDSFVVRTPHSIYSATTPPIAGCGLPLPLAPPRNFQDQDREVKFFIRTPGEQVIKQGVIPGCGHYLFSCSPH